MSKASISRFGKGLSSEQDPDLEGEMGDDGNNEHLWKHHTKQISAPATHAKHQKQKQSSPGQDNTASSDISGPSQADENQPTTKGIFAYAPPVADPDPAAARLDDRTQPLSKEAFYTLMGMDSSEHPPRPMTKLQKKHGLYGRIQRDLRYVQAKYRIFDVAQYIMMGFQLLLSAVFIILGSIRRADTHLAIAILGGISTVNAGVLALMKGHGLPSRLRQTRNEMSDVLFAAEELCADVEAGLPVLFEDVSKIREDYMRVLQAARDAHPDNFRGAEAYIAKGLSRRVRSDENV